MDSALPTTQANAAETSGSTRRDTVTITDNRTGKSYEIPITHDTIRAMDLRQIKVNPTDFGMMSYDPAFNNTAACISQITYIDGDVGILRYRGYPIEELAEKSTYLETAYLLLHGELPTANELRDFDKPPTCRCQPPGLPGRLRGGIARYERATAGGRLSTGSRERAGLLLRPLGQILGHRSERYCLGDLPYFGLHPGLR